MQKALIEVVSAQDAAEYLEIARQEALKSPCFRSKCGSVIVKDGKVIGKGFNGPPGDVQFSACSKDSWPAEFKSDRTCCVHAEQRAIMDALKSDLGHISGSTLLFVRLDDNGNIKPAGSPYCTICSKMALDAGVSKFVLVHKDVIWAYETRFYNDVSFSHAHKV